MPKRSQGHERLSYEMVISKKNEKKSHVFYYRFRFHDEQFREECTQIYLEERTQYRQTGILRKPVKRPYYINPEKEKERIIKIRQEYERLEHKDD